MPEPPARARTLRGDTLQVAREHYGEGIDWLNRRDVASTLESRAACAVAAAAFFAAGQLALAIAEAEARGSNG